MRRAVAGANRGEFLSWVVCAHTACRYLQCMSTRTDDDSGIDLLLFVALQVSSEYTSPRPKFCITISLRVTPSCSVVVRLVTNLSLRYQDTVGAGLPAEIHQFLARCVSLSPENMIARFGIDELRCSARRFSCPARK